MSDSSVRTTRLKSCLIIGSNGSGSGGSNGSNGSNGARGPVGPTGTTGATGATGQGVITIVEGKYGKPLVHNAADGATLTESNIYSIVPPFGVTFKDANKVNYQTNTTDPTMLLYGDIIPATSKTLSLGSVDRPFKDAYFGANTLYIGNSAISSDIQGNITITARDTTESALPGGEVSDNFVVAVGLDADGTEIKYTTNGSNWIDISGDYDITTGFGVAWNGVNWIAVGGSLGFGFPSVNNLLISQTGKTWTPPSMYLDPNTDQTILSILSSIELRSICFHAYDNRWYAAGVVPSATPTYAIIRSTDSTGNYWEPSVDISGGSVPFVVPPGQDGSVVGGLASDGGVQGDCVNYPT